eukprot:6185361-Pleurochrysis_carterae.AAC.2
METAARRCQPTWPMGPLPLASPASPLWQSRLALAFRSRDAASTVTYQACSSASPSCERCEKKAPPPRDGGCYTRSQVS